MTSPLRVLHRCAVRENSMRRSRILVALVGLFLALGAKPGFRLGNLGGGGGVDHMPFDQR